MSDSIFSRRTDTYLSYCTFHRIRCQVACLTAAAFVIVFCLACSRDDSVKLSLDFSKAKEWRFCLDGRIVGTVGAEGSQRGFESAVRCTLLAAVDPKNSAVLHVSVASATFTSDILSDAELENLMAQSRDARVRCDLAGGSVAPDDTAALPLVRIGEWDVFKDLAKTIPALPKIPVRPGATWDRERAIPLDIRQGRATGHLIQSFCLDSVSAAGNRRTAYVRWDFTYRLELREADMTGLLKRMPGQGKGTGFARINVDEGTLESASMSFSVSDAAEGKFRMSWKEEISLNLIR
jgi:hypothetical protein